MLFSFCKLGSYSVYSSSRSLHDTENSRFSENWIKILSRLQTARV